MAPPSRSTSVDGREARSVATRERLLTTAMRLFGARGFDGVSTRELAEAAGVNAALITYHFGTKEGLYLAVAEMIGERGRVLFAPLLAADPAAAGSPRAAAEQLRAMLRGMSRGMLAMTRDDSGAWAFIVREQTHPSPAFDALFGRYIRPLHERLAALVGAATGRPATSAAVTVDTHALVGMALGFVVAREALLRRTGWPQYTDARVTQIAEQVGDLAARALGVAADGGARRSGARRSGARQSKRP
jgi:TetR/AcrR family transcriptional regulator, regulator of cefoperazone and chloramphenicol sensitivity